MSWGEVIKAINSNINIPLNKRFGRIYDIYPRGVQEKMVSGSFHKLEAPVTVLDLNNASGFITAIKSSSNLGDGFYSNGAVEVILDDARHYIVRSSTDNGFNASLSVSLNTDVVGSSYLLEDDITVNYSSISVNFPLYFKNHFIVKAIETNGNGTSSSCAYEVSYLIEHSSVGGVTPKIFMLPSKKRRVA